MAQYICKYQKGEGLRWISHLDLKRTLERAMRRAQLPLELSQGHNPHPKISYGPPLGLGVTGEAEVFAVHLREAIRAEALQERLNAQFPAGLVITGCWVVPGYKKKETFGDLDVAEFHVTAQTVVPLLVVQSRIEQLLAQESLVITRYGDQQEREIDIRPMILSLRAEETEAGMVRLHMRLRTGSHGGAKPQEVVALLDLTDDTMAPRINRAAIYASGEAPLAPTAPRPQTGEWRRWGRPRGGK